MIIVTAPKKGLGQTVTSINMAIKIGDLIKNKVLLADFNQYCYGVETHLSNTLWTKGLDEFKNDLEGGLGFRRGDFRGWSKGVTPRLDIMASNRYFNINDNDILELKNYAEMTYSVTLVDSIAGTSQLTNSLMSQSKVVIVILNQDRSTVELIRENNLYKDIKGKVFFVVNRFMSTYKEIKVGYGIKEITQDIEEMGFENEIFTLPFDIKLLNDSNDSILLKYSTSTENRLSQYHLQLSKLLHKILNHSYNFRIEDELPVEVKKRTIFNIFDL